MKAVDDDVDGLLLKEPLIFSRPDDDGVFVVLDPEALRRLEGVREREELPLSLFVVREGESLRRVLVGDLEELR